MQINQSNKTIVFETHRCISSWMFSIWRLPWPRHIWPLLKRGRSQIEAAKLRFKKCFWIEAAVELKPQSYEHYALNYEIISIFILKLLCTQSNDTPKNILWVQAAFELRQHVIARKVFYFSTGRGPTWRGYGKCTLDKAPTYQRLWEFR